MTEENKTQNPGEVKTEASAAAPAQPSAPAVEQTPAQPAAPAESQAQTSTEPASTAASTEVEKQATAEAQKPEATPAAPAFDPAAWDGQKKQIEKAFVKAWSPRIFNYPFSLEIDVLRAIKAAAARNVSVKEPKSVMDTGGMFLSSVLLEVEGEAKEGDTGIVKLSGEYFCRVVKRNIFGRNADILDLQKELNGVPKELYFWHASYPKYSGSEAKTVMIASTEVTPLPVMKESPAPAATPAQPEATKNEAQQQAANSETPAANPAAPAPAQPEVPAQPATPEQPPAPTPAQPQTPEQSSAPSQPQTSEEKPQQPGA